MDYRRLGKSGLKVSEFSFGAWVTFGKQVGEDDAASIMGVRLRPRHQLLRQCRGL